MSAFTGVLAASCLPLVRVSELFLAADHATCSSAKACPDVLLVRGRAADLAKGGSLDLRLLPTESKLSVLPSSLFSLSSLFNATLLRGRVAVEVAEALAAMSSAGTADFGSFRSESGVGDFHATLRLRVSTEALERLPLRSGSAPAYSKPQIRLSCSASVVAVQDTVLFRVSGRTVFVEEGGGKTVKKGSLFTQPHRRCACSLAVLTRSSHLCRNSMSLMVMNPAPS
mmetsp:Transcript_7582/g.20717  ORF Transcript_7582/g.20717 Transcript_7582/m.20717 type:complete len:227 (+) Transcript_7582:635-1315(+)